MAEKVKLAVIYYSSTGTNYQFAQWAKEAGEAAGAEVKLVKVPELAPLSAIEANPAWHAHYKATVDVPTATIDDMVEADGLIFSVPTRFGVMASQMKQYFDTAGGAWGQGKLANKVVSAMTSAQNPHGGQEATILSLYTVMHHWGAIIAAPGYTDPALFAAGGNPYGTSASISQDGEIIGADAVKEAVGIQARRTVEVAGWVKKGLNG
ncbi:NAD(P)H:quinone oxidoreductase [Planococcus lenghuensis]|uniref:NAD(P)H:quinone oxidoreductase, type IV n=1 Tax=Planococcus lenghuensis TaxID=2213202 RepID=A0A1Q2KV20_9BACL|nr:NAD(P)H:quinone oxidoreductase [Planococcus lenghuensis]AQQ52041.1 NAD(P)H:quinone oxidoreductase, type IV [Planococcus lenghuensis]